VILASAALAASPDDLARLLRRCGVVEGGRGRPKEAASGMEKTLVILLAGTNMPSAGSHSK
jgi:hypothetical protein